MEDYRQDYFKKYLKYKTKYIQLRELQDGGIFGFGSGSDSDFYKNMKKAIKKLNDSKVKIYLINTTIEDISNFARTHNLNTKITKPSDRKKLFKQLKGRFDYGRDIYDITTNKQVREMIINGLEYENIDENLKDFMTDFKKDIVEVFIKNKDIYIINIINVVGIFTIVSQAPIVPQVPIVPQAPIVPQVPIVQSVPSVNEENFKKPIYLIYRDQGQQLFDIHTKFLEMQKLLDNDAKAKIKPDDGYIVYQLTNYVDGYDKDIRTKIKKLLKSNRTKPYIISNRNRIIELFNDKDAKYITINLELFKFLVDDDRY
jgi:hypothetical protein